MAMFTEFKHKETKRFFEVRRTSDAWALANGLQFEIVIRYAWQGQPDIVRFASIKKTVVSVAVDEDAAGKPVFEKWPVIFTYECWLNMTSMLNQAQAAAA